MLTYYKGEKNMAYMTKTRSDIVKHVLEALYISTIIGGDDIFATSDPEERTRAPYRA